MSKVIELQLSNKIQLQRLTELLHFRDIRHSLALPELDPSPEKNETEQHCFYMEQLTACIRMSVEIQKTLLTLGIEATHGRMETETSCSKKAQESTSTEES